jgi:hypothetical protein
MFFDDLHQFFAEIMFLHKDYEHSNVLFEQIMLYSKENYQKRALMKSFKGASLSLLYMGRYKESMRKAKRALELAFYLADKRMELCLYDMIGKQYFYLNDLFKAKYFHNRMINCIHEPDESPIKQMFLKRLEARENLSKYKQNKVGTKAFTKYALDENEPRGKESKKIKNCYDSSSEDDDVPISKVAKGDYRKLLKKENYPKFYRLKKEKTQLLKIRRKKSLSFYSKQLNSQETEQMKSDSAFDSVFKGDESFIRCLYHLSANRDSRVHFHSRSRSDSKLSFFRTKGMIKSTIKPIGQKKKKISSLMKDKKTIFSLIKERLTSFSQFLEKEMHQEIFKQYTFNKNFVGKNLMKIIGYDEIEQKKKEEDMIPMKKSGSLIKIHRSKTRGYLTTERNKSSSIFKRRKNVNNFLKRG